MTTRTTKKQLLAMTKQELVDQLWSLRATKSDLKRCEEDRDRWRNTTYQHLKTIEEMKAQKHLSEDNAYLRGQAIAYARLLQDPAERAKALFDECKARQAARQET